MTREEATIQSLMGHIEALEEMIKALEEESKWIPVSKALPKKEEIVQITIDSSYYPRPYVDMGFYKVETKKWYWSDKEDKNPSIKVTAWMPLPEPYKTESEVQKCKY